MIVGDDVSIHQSGYKIMNARGTVPQCYGNESYIDDCNNIATTECSPVLVDCGTMASCGDNSSNSGNNMILYIVTITVLVAQAVVCAIILRFWKKRPSLQVNYVGTFVKTDNCSYSH